MNPLLLICLLFFAPALSSAAFIEAKRETNAQRLAAGLPLLPPKFKRTLPGYAQARNPTPANVARRSASVSPSPSPSPSPAYAPTVQYAGRLEVRSGGESLGVVQSYSAGSLGVTSPGSGDELTVTFTLPKTSEPFDILATNPGLATPLYLGTNTADELAVGSPNIVGFGNVKQTLAYSTPVSYGNQDIESSVWLLNPSTYELSVQYVNPDTSTPQTVIAYDSVLNEFFFTGDINSYNSQTDSSASAVNFYLYDV